MKHDDTLQRFIFENSSVRGQWVRLNQSYCTIADQHQYPALIRTLVGQMLVVACMLSAIVKFKGRLTVQFQGKGKLKLLLSQCTQELHLRGLAQWLSAIDEAELSSLFKEGLMVITIEPDKSVNRYQGIVGWEGDSIAQSIEGYFKKSEQLPTRLWIEVNETSATGLLLQTVPQPVSAVSQDTHDWEHLIHLTETITPHELSTWDSMTLLRRLYAEEEIRVFQPEPISFRCHCSRERSRNTLLMLEKEDIEEELKEKQQLVVTCEFCSKEYVFDRVDVAALFARGDGASSGSDLH
jgi:molecular chaperone Hsp33